MPGFLARASLAADLICGIKQFIYIFLTSIVMKI